jgi:hypothetical protein
MKRKPRGRVEGFTLVEILVVFVMVAVLATLAFGALSRAIRAGQEMQSSNNLRLLTLGNLTYAAEHGTFAPACDIQNVRRWHGARVGGSGPYDATKGFLSPYLGREARVIPCPVLTRMLKGGRKSFEEGSGGYGYNSTYLGGMRDFQIDGAGVFVPPPTTRLRRASETVMFASTAYARDDGVQEYPFAEPPFWDFGDGPSGFRPSPTVHFRFDGQAIISWCDGHISFVKLEERENGTNPHGGDAKKHQLGWFGPDKDNGYWNPEREVDGR